MDTTTATTTTPVTWILPAAAYDRLTRTRDADAVHDVLVDLLVAGDVIADPDGSGLLVVDSGARNTGHAEARFRLAVRRSRYSERRSATRERVRAGKAAHTTATPDFGVDPADASAALIDAADLRSAIRRLPEREQHVIVFHYFEHVDYPELADVLGITTANARKITQRARQHLAQLLTTTEDGEP